MASVFEQMLSRYQVETYQDRINAQHEVMHQICLAALNRAGFFRSAAFYGGTCLRIFHHLPRFSEGMDFSLLQEDETFDIENLFDVIYDEFKAMGRAIEIKKKGKSGTSHIESAFLKDNTDIVDVFFHTERKVKIKMEIDKNPPLGFHTEYKLLLLPYSFTIRCFDLPGLYAGKMHALLFRNWKNRVKGRDWFDFEWYIRNDYTLDFNHLRVRSIQSGYGGKELFTPEIFKILLLEKINSVNFDLARKDVEPFIKTPEVLAIWSADYFRLLTERIRFLNGGL